MVGVNHLGGNKDVDWMYSTSYEEGDIETVCREALIFTIRSM